MSGARSTVWTRRIGALVVALGMSVVGPAVAASAVASPAAAGPTVSAIKACAPAPAPNRPSAGLPGKLTPPPPESSPGDPFSDPDVAISDVYGYSYRWANYDNGCVPGASWGPGFVTGIGNLLLAGAAATNALVHSTLGFVVDPTWLDPLDQTITEATDAVRTGVWAPWITVALVLVAATVLAAAARAEVSNAVTSAAWALLVLVATTYVMSYPISSARAVDGLIQQTVTASAQATSTDDADDAADALTRQMDTINRNSLYSSWVEGTLGSSDSAVARDYGPDLFRASHMTWWEAETLDADPTAGQALIEVKKTLWSETAAKVENSDPLAYQQLTGNQGRWDAAATVAIMTAITMPFLLVAGVFVVIAYTVTRLFIPLAPALGVFGMLELGRGWVIGVVGQLGRFLIMGPLYWIGALLNLALISSVFASDVPFALQAVIALALPLMLFKLLRPRTSVPGSRLARRLGRLAVRTAATKGAVKAGVDDAITPDTKVGASSAGPVAHVPSTGDDGNSARQAAHATASSPALIGAAVDGRGTSRARPELIEWAEQPRSGQDLEFAMGGGAAARRAGAATVAVEQRVRAIELDRAEAWREHPALTPGEGLDRPHGPVMRDGRTVTPSHSASAGDEENLAAPAASRLVGPEDHVPVDIAEANVREEGGEQVFVLWRPDPASTTPSPDPDDRGGGR
ncbi:hypothetical protein FHR80_002932 [Cellulomonas cellasea]|uniref:TrbL/VirB6 plasmid conjugal transfer protein n=1 Tax=Cellulomonas cellasea TaxID=43670 RepID=A0A7W4UHM0_9CELL|nr:hypothetical protein [Cellulomonas cellasea]